MRLQGLSLRLAYRLDPVYKVKHLRYPIRQGKYNLNIKFRLGPFYCCGGDFVILFVLWGREGLGQLGHLILVLHWQCDTSFSIVISQTLSLRSNHVSPCYDETL